MTDWLPIEPRFSPAQLAPLDPERPPDRFVVDGCVWLVKDNELWEIDPEMGRAVSHGPLLPSQTIERWALCDMPIDGG